MYQWVASLRSKRIHESDWQGWSGTWVIEEKHLGGERQRCLCYRRYFDYDPDRAILIAKGASLVVRVNRLIGNEAFVVTAAEEMIQTVHQIADADETVMRGLPAQTLKISKLLPVNGLINSHIAVFGNTGSESSIPWPHYIKQALPKYNICSWPF